MGYDNDNENRFFTDKPVTEKENLEDSKKLGRQGYIQEEIKKMKPKVEEEEEKNGVITYIAIFAIVVFIVFFVSKVVMDVIKKDKLKTEENTTNITTNNESNTSNTSDESKNTNKEKDDDKHNNSSDWSIASTTDNYDVYPVNITSIVHVKGGNFFNNHKKIKGDKVYVEYKEISGLKDKNKQNDINKLLKDKVVSLYDKNYLGDGNILYVDIHTKISVNFDTISYAITRVMVDIDGKDIKRDVVTLNIRLDTLKEIEFEELFAEGTDIASIYKEYKKGKINSFYFDAEKIEVYDNDKVTTIDVLNNYKNIVFYKKFLISGSIYDSIKTSTKVFTNLSKTVSQETKDRAFSST